MKMTWHQREKSKKNKKKTHQKKKGFGAFAHRHRPTFRRSARSTGRKGSAPHAAEVSSRFPEAGEQFTNISARGMAQRGDSRDRFSKVFSKVFILGLLRMFF